MAPSLGPRELGGWGGRPLLELAPGLEYRYVLEVGHIWGPGHLPPARSDLGLSSPHHSSVTHLSWLAWDCHGFHMDGPSGLGKLTQLVTLRRRLNIPSLSAPWGCDRA